MTADLSTVPLVALSEDSKQVIATLLNSRKSLFYENNVPRDWRGFAHLLDLNGEVMSLLASNLNPTMYILTMLKENLKNVTMKDFQMIMEQMDRWDIIDDTIVMFENDAVRYLEQKQRSQISVNIDQDINLKVLTSDDVHRLNQGLETQHYDAFLLYADEDVGFANEMIQKLEVEYKLKLCFKDRDLIGGLKFEHEAIMKLISDRCNRLLIIISPDFLESEENEFFINYAQALSIDKRQRKIIPCLYKKCELPSQLRYMSILDYNHRGLYDFWNRLYNSVQAYNSKHSSTLQAITKVTNIAHDKYNDMSHQKIYEPSKYLQHDQGTEANMARQSVDQQKKENSAENNDIEDLNITIKKSKTLLDWIKGTTNRKTKEAKPSSQSTTEIVENLPSLNNLDSLDSSTSNVHEKKNKRKMFGKFTKKVRMKKTAVQAW